MNKSPFAPGDRIVDRARPQNGSLIVERCVLSLGHWRVEAHAATGQAWTSAPAELFVSCPEGWVDPDECPRGGQCTGGDPCPFRRVCLSEAPR